VGAELAGVEEAKEGGGRRERKTPRKTRREPTDRRKANLAGVTHSP
jgi:hypothetical protein